MTNEELAERIQAGENELMEELWRGVERLVVWQARRVLTVLDGYGGALTRRHLALWTMRMALSMSASLST